MVQVNLLVGRQVASFFEGSIQYLNLADRLYQLPLGVVAIAIGVVLLPELSRRLAAGDDAGGRAAFNRATEFALVLTLPAAMALIVIPGPLTSVLFERGRFTGEDAAATALALAIYGFGLPAFVLQKVVQPLYFARGDTKTPFRFALVGMVVNAVLAIGLAFSIGYLAAAVAASAASWVMLWLLWRGARRFGDAARADAGLIRRVARSGLASVAMGLALAAGAVWLAPVLAMPGWRYLGLAVLVGLGAAVYFGMAFAIGALSRQGIRRAVRR